MKFSQFVITKSKKGKLEVRNLLERGKYVIYDYRDVNTFEKSENKMKIVLKDSENKIKEFLIFPLKEKGKFLLVETEEKGERKVWNDKLKKEEDLFYD